VFEKNYRLQDIQLSKSRRTQSLAFSVKLILGLPTATADLPFVARAPRRSAFAKATAGILRVHSCAKDGGEYRARTGDLLVANQALSQLS
jgi:hypothetical protein